MLDRRTTLVGLLLAVVSAASFGTAGAFASGLLGAGWSAGAAVTVRMAVAALALTVPAVLQLRGRWHLLRSNLRVVAAFGALAVALPQLAYFVAVTRLSVGVALLLEYCGVLLVVLWTWARLGQRPSRVTGAGMVVAVAGLVLVLDVASGARIDPVGVMWGLLAAVGLASYFILSAATEDALPPLVSAWAGLAAGALVLGAAALVGLSEVLFAVLIAWLALGQQPGPVQLAGGVVVLAGIVLVRLGERPADEPAPTVDPVPVAPPAH